MYKGKHLKHEKPGRWIKSKALLVSLLLLVGVTIGGTLAFLVTGDGPVTNTFTPSEVTTEVFEDVSGTTKNSVKIKNTGDTTAYIRAAVVFTWQNEAGEIYGKPVESDDYTIVWSGIDDGSWKQGPDGFYYHLTPVVSEGENGGTCYTSVLFTNCAPVEGKAPEGYSLTVEIIGSGIQSVPTSVVVEEWDSGVSGVSDDGTLTIKQ